MTARIYTADDVRGISADMRLLSRTLADHYAASWANLLHELAASVEHHAARADAAEQERDALRARVAELESALRSYAPPCAKCGRPGTYVSTLDTPALVIDDAACDAVDGADAPKGDGR